MLNKTKTIAAILAIVAAAGAARAATDPVGDFLPTYAGTQSANLDIVGVDATFDGTNFKLSATMNGAIGSVPGAIYVWGVNRGAGTARLNAVSTPPLDPTVKWDALAVQSTDGTLRVVTLQLAGPPTVSAFAGGVTIDGNTISTTVPLALWPTRGFDPTGYTFQLWSRLRANPAADGTNIEIADFGPRVFASVPEPASWAMMVGGFGFAGTAVRRRRTSAAFA